MEFQITMTGFVALYIFMLAAFAGWIIIGRVPAILHTPLMSGSNFVHGIVVVGGIFALINASTVPEQAIGFSALFLRLPGTKIHSFAMGAEELAGLAGAAAWHRATGVKPERLSAWTWAATASFKANFLSITTLSSPRATLAMHSSITP